MTRSLSECRQIQQLLQGISMPFIHLIISFILVNNANAGPKRLNIGSLSSAPYDNAQSTKTKDDLINILVNKFEGIQNPNNPGEVNLKFLHNRIDEYELPFIVESDQGIYTEDDLILVYHQDNLPAKIPEGTAILKEGPHGISAIWDTPQTQIRQTSLLRLNSFDIAEIKTTKNQEQSTHPALRKKIKALVGNTHYKLSLNGCFLFTIKSDFKSGYLSIMYPEECLPIGPLERRGTFFLEVVHRIGRALALDTIVLRDDSKLRCEKDETLTSLTLLRKMNKEKEQKGWYESHGYEPAIDERDRYNSVYKRIAETSLASLLEKAHRLMLDDLKAESQKLLEEKIAAATSYITELEQKIAAGNTSKVREKNDWERKLKDGYFKEKIEEDRSTALMQYQLLSTEVERFLSKSEKQNLENLQSFLPWLWKDDCSKYTKIVDLIFDSEFGAQLLDSDLRKRSFGKLTKNL